MSVAPANRAEAGAQPSASINPLIATEATESPRNSPMADVLPEVGGCWQEKYLVTAALGEILGALAWRATCTEPADEVILRAVPVSGHHRRAAVWRALESIDHPNLQRAHAVYEIGVIRVEVQAVPPGESLATWSARGAFNHASIEQLLGHVTEALRALHNRGLVHFRVRPQNIFVSEERGMINFVLGGLEGAELHEQRGLLPVPVDPFYAPPEAAGLFQHSPGPDLCAWDWWSLGRVMQELILGRHIVGHLLHRDVADSTPELAAHAEALLLEHEAGATRAGGVEAMPALDQRLEQLLRGLLTSARDARWDGESIAHWLQNEPVHEYYRLPRNEQLFRWHGHAYTVEEAAEVLRSADNWNDAVEQIWNPEKPGTLSHFLGDSPAHRSRCDRLKEQRALATAFALKSLPPAVVREVVTAVALLELAGENLVWRGHGFDADGLQKIFGADGGEVDRMALLQAFTARQVVIMIERFDADAARMLTEFAQVTAGAESYLRQQRWFSVMDTAGRTRLLRHALAPLADLRAAAKALHDRFACSTDPALEKLFNLPHPTSADLVALLWVGDQAESRGFLTHPQWEKREYALLCEKAREQVAIFFWLRLETALKAGPWWFASWGSTLTAWTILGLFLGAVFPGPQWLGIAVAPVALGCVIRFVVTAILRRKLKRIKPAASAWTLVDGLRHCRAEARASGAGWKLGTVERELCGTNAEIAKLTTLQPPPQPIPGPPRLVGVWAVSLTSWLCVAGAVAVMAWHVKTQPPTWDAFVLAWSPPKSAALTSADGKSDGSTAKSRIAAGATGDAGDAHGPVKVSWPFKPGFEAQVISVKRSAEAGADQVRYATDWGARLVRRYKAETINTLELIRVPTAEKIGVMIFDGQHQRLENNRVYLIDYAPLQHSWVEIGGRSGIYFAD